MSRKKAKNTILNLIIDIGNTRAKLIAMEHGEPVEEMTSDSETLNGIDDFTGRHACSVGIISTVAKVGDEAKRKLQALGFPLLWLTSDTALPIATTFPPEMGSDRIAAIVGAMTLVPGAPLLIVDAGTCVTYEFIDDNGNYLGGNIAPGLRLRMLAMHEHTALLPLVEVQGETPDIGYDTDTAMRAGAVLGLKYEIEGYIRHYKALHPGLRVFLTGGDGFVFDDDLSSIIQTDHYLVPRGLNSILEWNEQKAKQ